MTREKRIGTINPFIEFEKKEIEQSLSDRFEKIVEKFSDRLAVKTQDREYDYRELNRAAGRVARAILEQNVPREKPVALLFDQGFQAISAILGALKSGQPFVFLDPSLSSDRNELILADSEARLVVTDARNYPLASSYKRAKTINIEEREYSADRSTERVAISPDTFACILYTSGSTGAPKGVVLNHRSLLVTVMNYTNGFRLSYEDRLCFLYSPSVIAGIRVILLALCNGAALCVFDLKAEGFARLADWLRRERITLYFSVASVFRHFTSLLTQEDRFSNVRLVRLGGEPVLGKDVESYKRHFSKDCLFVNRIGSTETGTFSWYCIDRETPVDDGPVPVGYPMEGYEVLLLDDDGDEVGADQTGEIAVKSRYLASGFWKNPDLTDSSFLPAPGGGEERIFRTGDLGRKLPNGCLIHAGRKDHQVKIRGFRVEIAEIDKALLDLDIVKDAVVVPWKGKGDEHRLVAYFVPEAGRTLSVSALRQELAQKLPAYMVPTHIVRLDEFPRAPNGKVNRGVLPPPGNRRPELEIDLVLPRNPVEKKIADIWGEVLGLEEVGVDDPFLELGGDSLQGTQIIARVLEKFHVDIPIAALMATSTVSTMTEMIETSLANKIAADRKRSGEELGRIVTDLESLSDEEAQNVLRKSSSPAAKSK